MIPIVINPIVIILIGFVAGMGVMVIKNLYEFSLNYFNRKV